MPGPPRYTFFASCAPGLEPVLLAECRALRLSRVEGQVGGVRFEGPAPDGWRAVLHLRTATRVFRRVARFPAADPGAVYRGAMEVPWERYIGPGRTFAVDAKVSRSSRGHSGFLALRVKDAIADRFRERYGARPDVDADSPDVPVAAYVHRDVCTLSLDLSGHPLHRRGYRAATVPAPLTETLAAGIVALSGWDRRSPFLDPFCGSGTILIEAALAASGTAPGLLSGGFAFERHPDFDRTRWEEMREAARRAIRAPRKVIIRGSDADPEAVRAARRNIEAAGAAGLVEVEVADARDFAPRRGWGAFVVSNPPYGVRLDEVETLVPLYEAFGRVLRERCAGYHVHLLLAGRRLARALALRPERYWRLTNGGLACRLVRYEIRG